MFLVLSIYAIADKMLLALKVNNQFAATWQLEIINYNTSSRDIADSQALSTWALCFMTKSETKLHDSKIYSSHSILKHCTMMRACP